MPDGPGERYLIYPKKKERKRIPWRDEHFLKRSFEWLKWKPIRVGDFNFHKPCLEE